MRKKRWSELTPFEKCMVILEYVLIVFAFFYLYLIWQNFELFAKMMTMKRITILGFLENMWLFFWEALLITFGL